MAVQSYGGKITVGVAAQNLTALIVAGPDSTFRPRGIRTIAMRASASNAGTVYLVRSASSTADDVSSRGFLAAGESFSQPFEGYENTDTLFLVASQASQIIYLSCTE